MDKFNTNPEKIFDDNNNNEILRLSKNFRKSKYQVCP